MARSRLNVQSTIQKVTRQIEKKALKINSRKSFDGLKVPTPSTLLNCACSDYPDFAFLVGSIVNIIGDSWSGKTFLALSIFAELNLLPDFDDYDFIYDDSEYANQFNMEYLFGPETSKRIHPPAWEVTKDENGQSHGHPIYSDTVEDFHCNVRDHLDGKKPFIYVLDSFDALDTDQDREKVEEMREARRRKTKPKGTYGMAKAKGASTLLRNIDDKMSKTDSLLIIISQTRDNLNPLSFKKSTRSGGRALKFYCSHEIWLAAGQKHESKGRIIGNNVLAKVEKAKLTGKVREAKFAIFHDLGVDDIRSCIDFLVYFEMWKKSKQTINAEHFKIKGTMATIISAIEKRNLEPKLKKLVGRLWHQIEDEIKLNRKKKYI